MVATAVETGPENSGPRNQASWNHATLPEGVMSIKNCRWLRYGTLAIAGLIVSRLPLMAQQLPHSASPSQQKNSANTERSVAQKLPAVHLDGTYFTRDGKRFIPVGAHWVPAKAAMQWPVQWDPKDIEADFAKMHELGASR
jgi:hypothetical protein